MLKEKIQNDATQALKTGEQFSLGVLRMLLAAITSKEKDKRYKISKQTPDLPEAKLQEQANLSDEEAVDVISSEIKKRKDAIALYQQGNRPELAENEAKEIEVFKKYLPEQLSAEELKNMIAEAVSKTGAKEMKDMGKVMAELAPKIKGRADNSEVSKIIKEILLNNK